MYLIIIIVKDSCLCNYYLRKKSNTILYFVLLWLEMINDFSTLSRCASLARNVSKECDTGEYDFSLEVLFSLFINMNITVVV